jgi:hypothetical protein
VWHASESSRERTSGTVNNCGVPLCEEEKKMLVDPIWGWLSVIIRREMPPNYPNSSLFS